MTNQTKPKDEQPVTPQETEAADAVAPEETPAEPESPAPTSPLEVLATENDALRDRLMRTMADMENLRRRTEREKQDASRYAISRFAQDLLAVGDNLARALASIDQAARDAADEATRNLIAGIEVTERELQNVMLRHGISRVAPDGDRFDPNFHQAMFEVEDATVPAGTVIQVVQPGYLIGERVLRPAMVGVSKGGPRPGAEAPPPSEEVPQGGEANAEASTNGSGASDTPTGQKIDRNA